MIKQRIINLAIRTALKSSHNFRLGAVVYKGKRVINQGFNKARKTHTMSKHPYSTIHAEVDAIIGVRKHDLVGASIYIHRLLRTGEAGLAKPCRYCMSLLEDVGIEKVDWSE